MTDAIPPLTTDEAAVLEIAASGASMMPIGRWERPVLALTQRGFLERCDSFNYYITQAGRAALKGEQADAERAVDRALAAVVSKSAEIAQLRDQLADKMNTIAELIADICRQASAFSGETPEKLARAWLAEIRDQVLIKLQEPAP